MGWELTSAGYLVFHNAKLDVYWQMPAGFQMPSPALLNLAEYLLLRGVGVRVPEIDEPRPFGRRVGLAYSGGVDSTAAFELLPNPIPVYTEVASPGRLHKLDNALLAVRDVCGISIKTNSDELARAYEKPRGFYGTGAFTIPLVLLADHLDIGVVADGNVLETVYLHSKDGHGTRYHRNNYDPIFARFRRAGLEYCMPCAGLTEVSTTKLAKGYRYAMGCMRGVAGDPCNNCAKCYRKRALQGNPIAPCAESESKISREIVPMLPSLLWAIENQGLIHPLLTTVNKDIEWVDKWYEDAEQLIPASLRSFVRQRLNEEGIVSLADDKAIREWVSNRV